MNKRRTFPDKFKLLKQSIKTRDNEVSALIGFVLMSSGLNSAQKDALTKAKGLINGTSNY